MPRRQKKNRNRRRRPGPRKARSANRVSGAPRLDNNFLITNMPTPLFPVSMRQKNMKYYDWGQQVTVAAGVCNTRFFAANGLYDPDITGTGHQPMGFDQMMGLYEQYYALNASITVTAITETAPAAVGLYISPDTTSITDPIRLIENGQMKFIHLDAATTGSGQRIGSVSLSCNLARQFGRRGPRAVVNDPDLGGGAASNPVEITYFGVVVFSFFSTASTNIVDYDVLLNYDAVFTEPRKLAVS